MKRSLLVLLPAALLLGLAQLLGWFGPLDRALIALRAELFPRAASGELILVEVSLPDLVALEEDPGPGPQHARAIEHLINAGAGRIGYAIDVRRLLGPEADPDIGMVLAFAGPQRIALASDGDEPLPEDAGRIALEPWTRAVIGLQPDQDGRLRRIRMRTPTTAGVAETIAMSVWLADRAPARAGNAFLIDPAIDPATLPRLAMADLIADRFDPALVTDKRVLIGITDAAAIGTVDLPPHGPLTATMAHALAAETLLQGRSLERFTGWPVAALAMLLTVASGLLFLFLRPLLAVAVLGAAAAALITGAMLLQPTAAVALDLTGLLLALPLGAAAAIGLGMLRPRRAPAPSPPVAAPTAPADQPLLDHCFDAVLTFDRQALVLSANPAAEQLFGRPRAQLVGAPVEELLTGADDATLLGWAEQGGLRELTAAPSDATARPVAVGFSRMLQRQSWTGIATIRPLAARAAGDEERIVQDQLTDLPNQAGFNELIREAIERAAAARAPIAVLLIELGRMQAINETLGHQLGDRVLAKAGRRLQEQLREVDSAAKLSGDRFALLLGTPCDRQDVGAAVRAVIEAFKAPFVVQGLTLHVGITIGIALYPEHGVASQELLHRADIALCAAREDGQDFAVYDSKSDVSITRQSVLSGKLRRALDSGQLRLTYEPRVAARGGRPALLEARVSSPDWSRDDKGLQHLLTRAERGGLGQSLMLWMIDAALEQQEALIAQGHAIDIAIRMGGANLYDRTVLDRLAALSAERLGAAGAGLRLQIDEDAVLADPEAAARAVKRIAPWQGLLACSRLAAAHASLIELPRVGIDSVKIDLAAIVADARGQNASPFIASLIRLAKNLKLQVAVAGVAREDVHIWLLSLGCEQIQGSLIAPPMDGEAVLAWLDAAGREAMAEGRAEQIQHA